ncbi:MAG: type III-A CRISPR-associated RAMP protein Csm5, partial [Rhodospirillaceae bacterium]|nr:type III-A CRISPR-associated RAMP protein Csm5 [Rhodospirillaceae bacterium]
MTPLTFQAVTWTPVHIGDGTTLTPESFDVRGDALLRFEPAAVLAALDDARRRQFVAATDRDLKQAQKLLRQALRDDLVLERIELSEESREEVCRSIEDPGRAGRIHPFIRTGGRPFLPGSAVKGALRTALLSARAAPLLGSLKRQLDVDRIQGGRSGPVSDELQATVLETSSTDTDPFRFVRVADADLPESATRYERVVNRKRNGEDNEMQMHFECLKPGTAFTLALAIDPEAARSAARRDSEKAPRRPIDAPELIRAASAFFRRRWATEAERFFRGQRLPAPPEPDADGYPLLLRIGRFSHFESASVDGLRRGWRPQTKSWMYDGGTRMVVRENGTAMPLGWILLARPGEQD